MNEKPGHIVRNGRRVINPVGVKKAMEGLEPGTSEWRRQESAVRKEIEEAERHPDAWFSTWWTLSLSRLQLDLMCRR